MNAPCDCVVYHCWSNNKKKMLHFRNYYLDSYLDSVLFYFSVLKFVNQEIDLHWSEITFQNAVPSSQAPSRHPSWTVVEQKTEQNEFHFPASLRRNHTGFAFISLFRCLQAPENGTECQSAWSCHEPRALYKEIGTLPAVGQPSQITISHTENSSYGRVIRALDIEFL